MWQWLADNVDQIQSISALVTAVVVLAGAAYGGWRFGFVPEFEPRMSVEVEAEWRADFNVLELLVTVENTGRVPVRLATEHRHNLVVVRFASEAMLAAAQEHGVGVMFDIPQVELHRDVLSFVAGPRGPRLSPFETVDVGDGESKSAGVLMPAPNGAVAAVVDVTVVGHRRLAGGRNPELWWTATRSLTREVPK